MLARVAHGESMTITRDGEPVAQVVPLPRKGLSTAEIQRQFARLPSIDSQAMRKELDEVVDPLLAFSWEDEELENELPGERPSVSDE